MVIFRRQGNRAAREAAIALVREAAAAGRITEPDRNHRIRELAHATSEADIEVHVRDLRRAREPDPARAPETPTAPPAVPPAGPGWKPPGQPGPPARFGPPGAASPFLGSGGFPGPVEGPAQQPAPSRAAAGSSWPAAAASPPHLQVSGSGTARPSGPTLTRVLLVLGVFVGVSVATPLLFLGNLDVSTDADGPFAVDVDRAPAGEVDQGEPAPDRGPALFTPRGFDDFVAAVRRETGATTAYTAVVHPDHATVDLREGRRGNRYRTWHWTGELAQTPIASTAHTDLFDLAAVEPRVLARLVRRAARAVDDATNTYVVLRGADAGGPATATAYASNVYGETKYLRATLDGSVLAEYP